MYIVCSDFFQVGKSVAWLRIPGYSTHGHRMYWFFQCKNSRSTHSGIFYWEAYVVLLLCVKTATRRVPGYSTERQTVCSTFTMCNNSRSTHSGIFYSGTSYVVIFYKLENWSRDCVFRDILLKDIVCSDFFLCWHIGRVTAYSGIFYSGTLYVRMEHVGPTCSLLGRPTA